MSAVPLQGFWTAEELRRILAACSGCQGYGDNLIRRSLYWRAVLMTIHNTRLSRFWLVRIRRSWLRHDGTLVIPKRRSYQLTWATIAALAETYPPQRDVLLPWPNGRRSFYDNLGRIFDRAEIPHQRRYPWIQQRKQQCA